MNRSRFVVIVVAALLFAAVVGGIAYNVGVANGIEHSGRMVVAPGAGAGHVPYPYNWYRPWGFGFPFFFPLFFFILLIAFLVRGVFGRVHRYGYGCGPEGRLDEWHRRAHERMWNEPSGTGAERAPR